MLKNIFLALIPIFVAVDAIGCLPIFISITQGLSKEEKKSVIYSSMITGLGIAFVFIFLGKIIFNLLGITIGDFMISGGIILMCISITDILNTGKVRRIPSLDLGAVPLGTPLIVGPAVLTTSLIIINEYGLFATLISISLNIFFAGLIFSTSEILIKILGQAGTKVLSKVMALLLSAIAVMMVRKGILLLIS